MQKDRDVAINCLRTALAPCALDAYPEACEEFKHVLFAFIYDKDDQNSPVAFENELCRMKMNDSVVDELVHEYCVCRGLVGSATESQPETQVPSRPALDVTESGSECCLSQKSSIEEAVKLQMVNVLSVIHT